MTCDDLRKIRRMHEQMESLDERILRLRAAMEPGAQHLSKMPHGTAERDKMAGYMARLDELENQRLLDVINLEEEVERAEVVIRMLPDLQQRVVRNYYVRGAITWRAVGKTLNYSERHCKRIGAYALENLEKMSSYVPF